MTIRSLREGEGNAILDLWDVGFDDTSRAYFERYLTDPSWRWEDTVVCEVEGRLVSAVHAVRRRVRSLVGELGLAGIANVATHPDFRGKGYNTACFHELLTRLEADPTLDFCLLGTDIFSYYARFGFERWEFAGREGTPVGAVRSSEDGLQVRAATPADLDAMRSLYEHYNHQRPFTLVRPEAYWEEWMHLDFGQVLLATDDQGTPLGYALHRVEDEVLLIEELAAQGEEHRVLEALLVEATRRARTHGVTRLRLLAPLDDTLQEVTNTLLVDASPFPIDWWMVRPLHNGTIPFGFGARRPFFWESDSF